MTNDERVIVGVGSGGIIEHFADAFSEQRNRRGSARVTQISRATPCSLHGLRLHGPYPDYKRFQHWEKWNSFGTTTLAVCSPNDFMRCESSLERGADGLHFCVHLEHFVAHLAAPARLLVSAEWQRRVEDVIAVDPHRAGAQLLGDAVRLAEVLRPDARGEAV